MSTDLPETAQERGSDGVYKLPQKTRPSLETVDFDDEFPLLMVELFAGIGASSAAMELAGIPFATVAIAEIDPFALKAYYAIHGYVPNLGDVRNIERLPPCDLVTYTFPCQDLSAVGLRAGMAEGSDTHSSLVWEVGRILEAVPLESRPHWLVMENVPEVHNGRNLGEWTRWLAKLKELGYSTYYTDLNSANFGVPQHRERCFAVSVLGGPLPWIPRSNGSPRVPAWSILEPEVSDEFYSRDYKPVEWVAIPPIRTPAGYHIAGNLDIKDYRLNKVVYSPSGLLPCLTYRHAKDVMVLLPDGGDAWTIRRITEREAWRLMGQTDEAFDKAKAAGLSRTRLYALAGNSIVVPVLAEVFRSVVYRSAPTLEAWGSRCWSPSRPTMS